MEVGGKFDCAYNQLKTLDGSPQKVDGSYSCSNNKVKFTEEEVKDVCNVNGGIYC